MELDPSNPYQPWFIALAGAVFTLLSVYIGHWLTLRMQKKRADALENGLYNELQLIKDQFEIWLPGLIDEFRNPVRSQFSGYSEIDMSCIDSLVVELISANRLLSKDQRALLLNLKSKSRGIVVRDIQRDEATKWYDQKNSYMVSVPCTARLILDAVEVISYLHSFLCSDSSFTLSSSHSWEDRARLAFSESGIEFDIETWKKIEIYGPDGSS